ncbi:hypothetical protein ACFIQF_02155 [Comamonas sp. J-3]|uniref:hypothetical protein n=1 Tax=Comamonas trifloxystrobinivorans TaxID=3350256 RepID=UPI0037289CED
MPDSYKQNKTRHQPLRQWLRVCSLLTAMAATTTFSLAQSNSGIGLFVPTTELGFSVVAVAGEQRINRISGE